MKKESQNRPKGTGLKVSGKNLPFKKPAPAPLTRQLSESEIEELRQDMAEASRIIRNHFKKNPI